MEFEAFYNDFYCIAHEVRAHVMGAATRGYMYLQNKIIMFMEWESNIPWGSVLLLEMTRCRLR